VCVSLGSSPVKSKTLSNCPIRVPYNHEDSPEERDMFADRDHCHELSLKIPEVNEQRGQRWQKTYRHGQQDSKWGHVGKETSDARGTPAFRWRWAATGSDNTVLGVHNIANEHTCWPHCVRLVSTKIRTLEKEIWLSLKSYPFPTGPTKLIRK
jgi:hypothetical protein